MASIVIQGYCVSCKESREMTDPKAVWTSKGQAATKGICPVCSTNMFRMGRTELHKDQEKPEPVQVLPKGVKKGKHVKAAYIVSSVTDTEFAHNLGKRLEALGVYTWIDDGGQIDSTAWSSGVHPAMDQCTHLIVVQSQFADSTASVKAAWEYFMADSKKKIIVALAEDTEPPDDLRSRPRFNFAQDDKSAFRDLMNTISR